MWRYLTSIHDHLTISVLISNIKFQNNMQNKENEDKEFNRLKIHNQVMNSCNQAIFEFFHLYIWISFYLCIMFLLLTNHPVIIVIKILSLRKCCKYRDVEELEEPTGSIKKHPDHVKWTIRIDNWESFDVFIQPSLLRLHYKIFRDVFVSFILVFILRKGLINNERKWGLLRYP